MDVAADEYYRAFGHHDLMFVENDTVYFNAIRNNYYHNVRHVCVGDYVANVTHYQTHSAKTQIRYGFVGSFLTDVNRGSWGF